MKGWKPAPGYVYNPILKIARNTRPCICGEDRKFKNCCLPKMPPVITEAQAAALFKKVEK